MPGELSDLCSVVGVEARMQDDCSLNDCVTSALDSLKGIELTVLCKVVDLCLWYNVI